MKQLSFLYMDEPNSSPIKPHIFSLYIDGASRNNPGISGIGIVLIKDEVILIKKGCFIGIGTNNRSEYIALLLGIFLAKPMMEQQDILHIYSDSQLLVRQMQKVYKVKNELLIQLQTVAFALLEPMHYTIEHIYREKNVLADKLANEGIQNKNPLPDDFITLMNRYCKEPW